MPDIHVGDKPELDRMTFGADYEGRARKLKVLVTNPEGTLILTPFDDRPNRLSLMISMFPEMLPYNNIRVIKALRRILKEHGDCPEDMDFWAWYISVREGRVSTLHHDFMVMFQYLQLAGYYSKSFKPMFFNFRLKQRDGVRRGDLILSEAEIAIMLRKSFRLDIIEERHKQKALDMFVLALFTGARFNDIKTIVKSVDAVGNPILMYHNHKGTRSQTIAWNPAVEGALQRGLYKTMGPGSIMSASLKVALFEALPSSSNRLINYYYLRPGKGRQLCTAGRISHFTYHAARHTFCTRLLRIGVSPAIVAQLAGHKNIETTMKYYNWTKEQEANDILREVYGAKSVVIEKPSWGEDATGVTPLPTAVYAAQMPQTELGEQLPDDGGLIAKQKAAIKADNNRPTVRQKAWQERLKQQGYL